MKPKAWSLARRTVLGGLAFAAILLSAARGWEWINREGEAPLDVDDPEVADLVARGWIPVDLFAAMKGDVLERHHSDTNKVWIAFARSERHAIDLSAWRRVTNGDEMLDVTSPCGPRPWWHPDLRAACDYGIIPRGWSVYARGDEWLALHQHSDACYYWTR